MGSRANWLAASVFFLAGCMMLGLPDLIRGHLYAAMFSRPSWQYPSPTVEKIVPDYLRYIGIVAFGMAAAAIVLPLFRRPRDGRSQTPAD
ncbi:putative sodium:solute symporter family permease YidK [Symbiobacterium terraclitae]|uniref:Sodium:solute symporter family permease YidK n=1 Tax=Symbiobacterium terraclitae TaxID=557451 RepID=A0ABS4JQ50_9FIRM|nr:putative sodium:solute symporter family permease YidK [Symbiobacterium terraclitae]